MTNDSGGRTGPELLIYMGTDAAKWAAEWVKRANQLVASNGHLIDEGWMISWFANAIEAGRSAGIAARND